MLIKRKLLASLHNWKNQTSRKPLLVTGVRQCGKSYLLRRQFGPESFRRCHIFDFKEKRATLAQVFAGDLDPQTLLDKLAIVGGAPIDASGDLIVFDEVQECLRALESLKHFSEQLPEAFIAATGSLLNVKVSGQGLMELDEGTFSYPVGKLTELSLFPLSFHEFLAATTDEPTTLAFERRARDLTSHERLLKAYRDYLFVGGMPEVVSLWIAAKAAATAGELPHMLAQIRALHDELIGAYQRDFVVKGNLVNGTHLAQVYRSVFTQIGLVEEHDGSLRRYEFKGVLPRKNRYADLHHVIDWLELAGLVQKVYVVAGDPTAAPRTKVKESMFKLVPHDVGLLGAQLGLDYADLVLRDVGAIKGPIAEVFVANELRAELLRNHRDPLISWTDQKRGYQLEFLLKDGRVGVYPIEVKAGTHTKATSLERYAASYHPVQTVKLTARAGGLRDDTGTLTLPLYYAGCHTDFFAMPAS